MKKRFIYLFLIGIVLDAYPVGWSDDILISEDTTICQSRPDIDTDSWNNVWISWDYATLTEGEIYYSKRDSLGSCLIPGTVVSNNASKSWMARIAVKRSGSDLDNVQFIWRDVSPQGFGIWHAKLANNGTVIVSPHLAVSGAGGGTSSFLPEMVLDKYHCINIGWDERPLGYNQINYTKLDNLGNPILDKIRVSPEDQNADWVGIGVDSFANCHLGYRCDTAGNPDRLAYSKINKDGYIVISNLILNYGGSPTLIADRNQNIHIVYTCLPGSGIRIGYLKLDQNGNVLVSKIISPVAININHHAHMAMDSLQYLHVVWCAEQIPIGDVIMYTKLDTMGDYVIQPMRVVNPPYTTGPDLPRIAVDCSNRLHVTWVDDRLGNTSDIFYKRGENEPGIEEQKNQATPTDPKILICPNPFFKDTNVRFLFSRESENTVIQIYNICGRKVREFIASKQDSVITWNGADHEGNQLAAGVYFIRISSPTVIKSLPVILLK